MLGLALALKAAIKTLVELGVYKSIPTRVSSQNPLLHPRNKRALLVTGLHRCHRPVQTATQSLAESPGKRCGLAVRSIRI